MRRIAPLLLYSALSALLVFVILWKGGKTLEATWLLTGVSAAAVFCALHMHPKEESKGVFFLPVLLLVLFAAWSLCSFVYSATRNYGFDEMLRDGACIALFLGLLPLTTASVHMEHLRKWVVSSIAIATLCASAIGVGVYVLQPVDRFVGTFLDFRFHTDYWPNAWAEYLLLAWPLLVVWLQPWRVRLRPVRFALLGFVLGTLLLSYSRGAMLAFCGQIVVAAVLVAWQLRAHLHIASVLRVLGAAVTTMAIACLVFFAANGLRSQFFAVQSVTEKVTFTAAEGTSSIDERASFWSQAKTMALQRPLLGWGPYSFRFVQPRMQQGILATADHPHNLFLKLAAERGISAAVVFGLFLLVVLLEAAVALMRTRNLVTEALVFTAILGVLAHNQIDYNLQFVGIILPFWVLLLLITPLPPIRRLRLRSGLVQGIAFTLAMLCFFAAVRETPVLQMSSRGRSLQSAGQLPQALEAYAAAKGQWYPRDLLLSTLEVQLSLHRQPEALAALKAYRLQNLVDPRVPVISGYLALSQRNPEEALSAFSLAFVQAGKNDASAIRGLLLTLQALRRPALTRQWEPQVIGLMEQYASAIAHNTHFIALSRNVEEMQQSIALARLVYPAYIPELTAMEKTINDASERERGRLQARPGGLLW